MLVSLILLFGSALATPLPSGKASTSSNTGIGGVQSQQQTHQGPSGGLPGLGQNPSQGPPKSLFISAPVPNNHELPPMGNEQQGPSELPPMGNEQRPLRGPQLAPIQQGNHAGSPGPPPGLDRNPRQGPPRSLFIFAPVPNNRAPRLDLPPIKDLRTDTSDHPSRPPPRPNNPRSQR